MTNSLEIAERCSLDLNLDSGDYHMPEFQVSAGRSREEVLSEQAWRRPRERLPGETHEPLPEQFADYRPRADPAPRRLP